MLQSTLDCRKGAPGLGLGFLLECEVDMNFRPTVLLSQTLIRFLFAKASEALFPFLAFLALVTTFLAACGGPKSPSKASNFEGTLGSCNATAGFFLDDEKTQEALPCTEHSYVARGTSDPGPSLAASLSRGCKEEGGTWSTSACQGYSLACKTQTETLQPRAADVTLTRKTSWKPKGSFSLGAPDDRKKLCP